MKKVVKKGSRDHAVVSVLGVDKVGIVAKVTGMLAKNSVNIVDISQTIMRDLFTMIMLVDLTDSEMEVDELSKRLERLGRRIGVQILVQHEKVFRYMHRI